MKSNILFVMHVPPPVHGAAIMGTYIHNSSLINGEFDAEYINLSTNTKLGESGKGSLAKVFAYLRIQSRLVKALLRKNYDLCYLTLTASGPGFYKDLTVVAICKLFGKKIIYHFHNKGVGAVERSFISDAAYRYAFRNTFSILLSQYLYADIDRYASPSNVFYCVNGIPENTTKIEVDNSSQDQHEPCQLLFLSNMMEQKGVYELLTACEILAKRGRRFKCDFIGAWSDVTSDLFQKELDQRGLNGIVEGHGAKYGGDKAVFFAKCDVFVFPTFYHFEAFPLVLLEAMQHQLPVVSCPEGGIPDIVVEGETGYLVPQRDPNALADKLEILILNPQLRKQMGIAGKQRFEKNFRLETFESNMRDILRTAIETNPS